jgi:hypothetical protein
MPKDTPIEKIKATNGNVAGTAKKEVGDELRRTFPSH